MKKLVRVKNCVTIIATLPGTAVTGIMKLENDINTLAEHGM